MKFGKNYKVLKKGIIKRVALSAIVLGSVLMGSSEALADIDYSFVVTSDPQYPWTAKTDDGIPQSESDTKAESESLILNQYHSINDYSKSIGNKVLHTTINGDITAYGHDWQWQKMRELLPTLQMPYSYGLGNHDIENNYDDTFLNQAWRNSFSQLFNYEAYNQISKDTWTENYPPFGSYKFIGSLDYSQKVGDFRMIMANNYPTMTASSSHGEYKYWLTPGMDYIEKQLEEAKNSNQPAILFIHKPDDWKWDNDPEGRFKSLVEKYYDEGTLRAVFVGHYHKKVGKFSYPEHFGKVPVYSSGSASQKAYLISEVDHAKNEMKIYKVNGNVWENKELVDTIAINSKGLAPVDDAQEYEQQKELAKVVGDSYHLINSLDSNKVLDDSDDSDDVIYYDETKAINQQWKLEFSDENNCFTIQNKANNFLMYESDSRWNGFSLVRTGNLSASDSRAQWRVVSTGSKDGTVSEYKFRNVHSGKILTLNSYSGELINAATNATLLTAPDFGATDIQKFIIN